MSSISVGRSQIVGLCDIVAVLIAGPVRELRAANMSGSEIFVTPSEWWLG